MCGSVRVGGKNPKSVWWNDEVKTAVRRKEAEKMIMVEEWWSFVEKGDCVWVIYFKHRSVHMSTRWQGFKME